MTGPAPRRSGGWAAHLVAGVALVVTLGGCVAPSHDAGSFEANADAALSSAVSEARTAALVLQARLDGKVTHAYADTVITGSESALGPIQDSFGNVDPPAPGQDPLRTRVMAMLGDTADALAAARLSVRRDDTTHMRAATAKLTDLADTMGKAKDGLG